MSIDLWHHYLLLRPLLVFVLAAPLLVSAVLFRGRAAPRSSDHKTHVQSEAPSVANTGPDSAQEPQIESSPREWRASAVGSDRRAA